MSINISMLENRVMAFNSMVVNNGKTAKRKCIVCGRVFVSRDIGHRNCGQHNEMKGYGKRAEAVSI